MHEIHMIKNRVEVVLTKHAVINEEFLTGWLATKAALAPILSSTVFDASEKRCRIYTAFRRFEVTIEVERNEETGGFLLVFSEDVQGPAGRMLKDLHVMRVDNRREFIDGGVQIGASFPAALPDLVMNWLFKELCRQPGETERKERTR